MANSIGKRILP